MLHLEQRLDAEQPVVADIDMGADGEQALRHRKVAVAQRPLDHRLMGEERLQLAPQRDALEQRARLVEPRQAERQRRIHVEMAVDEGRRHEIALRIDGRARRAVDLRLHLDDAPVLAGDVLPAPAVGKRGVAQQQIEHDCPRRQRVGMGFSPR